jgi:photosynthetic reaction center cytochrome c subunit
MSFRIGIALGLIAVLAVGLALTLEHPPVEAFQRGYRGVGMVENYNPKALAALQVANQTPSMLAQLHAGPPAASVYKNVKVLGDVDVGEFTRLMASITTWVAPQQGCGYCHDTNNMASDALYTKVVARRMIEMVRHVNSDWKTHVAATGVTCYTCHRGQPVPSVVWFADPGQAQADGVAETHTGKNMPAPQAGMTSLPYDPLTPFLDQANEIRVEASTALAGTDRQSIKQTEWTYALMMHFSQALGVNCTFCHNSRSFRDWDQSTPQRVTAWYGIRMVRDLNTQFLDPLKSVFPASRLGPMGDNAKVNCATCHQGVYKPLFGTSLAVSFPELTGPTAAKP